MTKLMILCFLFIAFSCNNAVKEGESTAPKDTAVTVEEVAPEPVFTPFKILLVRHTVADFDKWKPGYLAHDSMRQAHGLNRLSLGRNLDNPKQVVVVLKADDLQKAKEFSTSTDLKAVMKKNGVTGTPQMDFIEVVRNDTTPSQYNDRMMVIHKVKDFDTWVKAFDGEGKEIRAANGIIDRGIARGIDDPNLVYILFVVSDLAKAKARANSPELKKLMTDAGVEGVPQRMFFKLEY